MQKIRKTIKRIVLTIVKLTIMKVTTTYLFFKCYDYLLFFLDLVFHTDCNCNLFYCRDFYEHRWVLYQSLHEESGWVYILLSWGPGLFQSNFHWFRYLVFRSSELFVYIIIFTKCKIVFWLKFLWIKYLIARIGHIQLIFFFITFFSIKLRL